METRTYSLMALLAICSAATAQQPPISSPQPYAGGTDVVWSHTFLAPNAFEARLSLSIDLGPGDVLVLKDAGGAVHWTYRGQGPRQSGTTDHLIDLGGAPLRPSFLSGAVPGGAVTAELRGSSGGHGVTVHAVHWQSGPMQAASSAGGCNLDVIAPAGLETIEGNSGTSFPWNSTSGMRVMYSYGRESVAFDRPVRICAIRYRPDGGTNSVTATDYDFRLDVSTSRQAALNLDRTFQNNHGADLVTVFDGVMSLAANSSLGLSPNPFVLEVPFDPPFEWDPRSGPLVLDFHHRGATNSSGTTWDIQSGLADAGRIAATTGGANATVANFPSGSSTQTAALIVDLCLEADVAPIAMDATEGNSATRYPFSRQTPMRVMYAYDESTIDFAGRHKITALSFRTDNAAAFAGDSYDLRVSMSTSVNPSNALNATFDANHGTDMTMVFEGIHVAVPAAASTAPGPFVLTIPLQTPFTYNPADGPLLIDMQLLAGVSSSVQWDGSFNTEPVYRIYSLTSATANSGTVQQFAMAVALQAEPIPTFPEADDSSFGSSSSSYPWNIGGQQRAMYQYDPSVIATDRPLYIQHLSWRPDGSNVVGPVSYTCTIDLSTSAVAAGAMTPTFNNNHGSDRARVFDGTFSVAFQDSYTDPRQFPISVKLDQPFYYDPANGPLLVDIRMLDTNGATTTCDGSFGAGLSRFAHLSNADANIADYPSSGNPQQFGLNLRLSGEGCNATSVNYGVACAGSNGQASCVNVGLATLPSPDFAIGLRNGPVNSFGFLVVGVSQTSIPLAIIGAPGCLSLTPGEIGAFGVPTSATGLANYPLPLPGGSNFNGFQFMTQWVSLDLGANQLGLTYSNGQLHTVCY